VTISVSPDFDFFPHRLFHSTTFPVRSAPPVLVCKLIPFRRPLIGNTHVLFAWHFFTPARFLLGRASREAPVFAHFLPVEPRTPVEGPAPSFLSVVHPHRRTRLVGIPLALPFLQTELQPVPFRLSRSFLLLRISFAR